jgi:hypothetical protein
LVGERLSQFSEIVAVQGQAAAEALSARLRDPPALGKTAGVETA